MSSPLRSFQPHYRTNTTTTQRTVASTSSRAYCPHQTPFSLDSMERDMTDNPEACPDSTCSSGIQTQAQIQLQTQAQVAGCDASSSLGNTTWNGVCAAKCSAAECSSSRPKSSGNSTSAPCMTSCADGCIANSEVPTGPADASCDTGSIPCSTMGLRQGCTSAQAGNGRCSGGVDCKEKPALEGVETAYADDDGRFALPAGIFIDVLPWLISLIVLGFLCGCCLHFVLEDVLGVLTLTDVRIRSDGCSLITQARRHHRAFYLGNVWTNSPAKFESAVCAGVHYAARAAYSAAARGRPGK